MANNLAELIVPMPDASMVDASQQLLDRIRLLSISNRVDYEFAANELLNIKARWNRIDAMRKALKAPIDNAAKGVQMWFGRPLDFLEQAEAMVKKRMAEFLKAEEAEQKRLQEAANREAQQQRAELGELADVAEAEGDIDTAQALADEAAMVVAPSLMERAPKVAGTSVRETWEFEITEPHRLPREFLAPDLKKIRGYVRAMRSEARIPGVRIWSEKSIAASGRRDGAE